MAGIGARTRPAGRGGGCRRRTLGGGAGQDGLISLFTAVIFVAFLLITGLVAEAAVLRSHRRELSDVARQAARAAVQEVDVGFYRATGMVRLDSDAATDAAEAAAGAAGHEAEVRIRGDRALVRVSDEVVLSVLGLGGRTVRLSGEDEARAIWGVSSGR